MVHAVDPDENGKILWQQRVGTGGTLGGVQWGSASDGSNVYVALSDIVRVDDREQPRDRTRIRKQAAACSRSTLETGERVWYTPPPACGTRPRCSPAQSAAVSVVSRRRVLGIGGRAPARLFDDGRQADLWDFDSVGPYKTVNEVPARGGSFDGPGRRSPAGWCSSTRGTHGRRHAGNVLLALSVDGR